MDCRIRLSPVLLALCLVLGCGGEAIEEEAVSEPPAPREDVQAEMKRQDKDAYTFQAKSGTKELQLDAKGSGDDSYTMEVKGTEGEIKMSVGEGAKLPENLPTDVPTYPGMTVTLSQSMAEKEVFNIQGTSTDSFDKVAAQFKSDTAAKGWTEATALDQNLPGKEMKMLQYTKEDRTLSIMLNAQEGGTNITISTSKK